MKIISCISQKGGTGKTTLIANLAIAATRKKKKVLLIDTDPQNSLYDWWKVRTEKFPEFIKEDFETIKSVINKFTDYDYVFIDTPPFTNKIINDVAKLCNEIIIPLKASPNDLRAINNTLNVVQKEKKEFVFAITQANKQAIITRKVIAELNKIQGKKGIHIISNRNDYITSMIDGESVFSIENSKSAIEIEALFREIK